MEDSSLTFARPLWLYAGPLVCAVMAWLFTRFDRRREIDLAKLVHPRFRSRLLPGSSPRLLLTKRLLWLACLLLLFTAAAGPQKGFEFREVKRRGIDLLFAIDTSRSMLAEDLSPNRLERARLGIHDFVNRLEGDRIGLIPFAGSSYALCPLTGDYEAFRASLNAIDTDLIPKQGTDVASAIREADRLFDEQANNHRILILITDGEDLQGDALEAATEAAKKGMVIYTVGVGSPEGAVIPLSSPDGRPDFVRDQTGAPVRTRLDETTLRRIAELTKGQYVPLGRGAEGLDTIYREKLRLVPKSEIDARMERIPLERFQWPLALALVCLVLEFLLPDRRRTRTPVSLPSAARRHPAMKSPVPAASSLLLLTFLSAPVRSEAADAAQLYNQGTAAYSQGDFKAAADTLRSSLSTPDLSLQNRAYYNLGNALYRSGQQSLPQSPEETIQAWEDSLKAYQGALALNPGDADAAFNRDLVQRKLEELKKQNPDKNKDDKDDKQDQKDKQDKEQKDQDKKEGEGNKDQDQKKEGGDPKDGQKPEQDKNGNGKESGEEKQEPDKDGDQNPDGTKPGDEKESGKDKDGDGNKTEGQETKEEGKNSKEPQPGESGEPAEKTGEMKSSAEERRKPGEMTPAEAQQLLQMMRQEERSVIPIERPRPGRFLDPNNTTKGKTW